MIGNVNKLYICMYNICKYIYTMWRINFILFVVFDLKIDFDEHVSDAFGYGIG